MATTQAQLSVQGYRSEIQASVYTDADRGTPSPSTPNPIQSLNIRGNSLELINRISDVVENIARLSRNNRADLLRSEGLTGWSIFDCAQAMEYLANPHRKTLAAPRQFSK
jgi:hypothetical protein